MGAQLFDRFAEMIQQMPPKAVLRAVQLEKQMLENDMAQKRTLPMAEVRSIVAFCGFLENAAGTISAPKISVPIQHLGFYRSTIKRMVEGGELPNEVRVLFESVFSAMMKAA
jgi:hypothetical protein